METFQKNNYNNEQIELEEVEELQPDDAEKMFDTQTYRETYSILKNAQRLTKNNFHVNEKQELIIELQTTIKKLNGLLVTLESDI